MPYTEKLSLELENLFNLENPQVRGREGEAFVANTLLNSGYKIIEKNLKTPYGEIDLLLCKNRIFYIIEVKTRKTATKFSIRPISSGQKKRLKLAATWVWVKYRYDFESVKCLLAIVTRRGIKWKNLSLLYDSN